MYLGLFEGLYALEGQVGALVEVPMEAPMEVLKDALVEALVEGSWLAVLVKKLGVLLDVGPLVAVGNNSYLDAAHGFQPDT
jgi:hypothetical protein